MENITILHCYVNSLRSALAEGVRHVKELPYLSIVQATEGYYSFGLYGEEPKDLACGECFIAPALARQEIIHHVDPATKTMSARWVFLDIMVNDTVPFDAMYALPAFPPPDLCRQIDHCMDGIFSAQTILDRKAECYQLLKLLLPYAREKVKREERVESAISYIQRHFQEPLTVERVAKAVHTSPSNLHRLFQEELGTSPMAYCNSFRLSHACWLLDRQIGSVQQIATQCGITDPFYFSKLFKKIYGISPSHYRKSLRS